MSEYALAFMANDRYYNWTIGFLESVRARNAALPLYCIPYDAYTRGIVSLRRAFDFEMLDIDFGALDRFADRLFSTRPARRHNLRKYATFALPYDEVAYFDVDMVMCIDPARLFGHVKPGKLDLVYFSTSPGYAFRAEQMMTARRLYPNLVEISAGAFISSPRVLTIEQIIEVVNDNRELYFFLRQNGLFDQPVFNFVLAHAHKICTHIRDCDSSLAGMAWSRNRHIGSASGGPIVFENSRLIELATNRDVVAVHWAGGIKLALEMINPRAWPLAQFRSSHIRSGKRRLASRPPQAQARLASLVL